MPWIDACSTSDIDEEDLIRWDHVGQTFAIYHSPEGAFFATAGLCTHENVHLCDGLVMGNLIECPKHNGQFDYRTGEAMRAPVCVNLRTFPVKVEGDRVFVQVALMARLTVKDLMDQRGKHPFAMLRVETLEEAEAAARAGVELLSVPPAMILDARFREAAPGAFAFPGDNFYEIGGTDDFLRWAFPLYKHGADGFYCSGSLATIRAMADHALPVCGHVGLIPSKRTWTGGFKAVGKTLDTAKLVWSQVRALEEAGAFAAEIEVVPQAITKAIAERTSLFLISMGAGTAGHAQYLFSDDVLGQNRGRIPRHAKVYANLAAEYDRLQDLRIAAMGRFVRDVHQGDYPAPQHLVDSDPDVVRAFRDWLDQVA